MEYNNLLKILTNSNDEEIEVLHELLCVLKKDTKWIVGFILLSFVWMGIAPKLYELVLCENTEIWLVKIYNIFNNNLLLNIPICFFFFFVCIKQCKKISSDIIIHLWHFLIIAFVYLLLYYQSPFKYAIVFRNIDYREFLSILLGGMFFFFTVLKIRWYFKSIELLYDGLYVDDNKESGFSPDFNKEIKHPDSLKKYAESIVKRLLDTDLINESFAVGITSEWGAGKTTFLRLLKETIGSKANIVEFNPWMCRTPEQVTNDFFSSLSHQLSKRYSSLSRPIEQYAKYLNTIKIRAFSFVSINLSKTILEGNLFDRKRNLSEKFSRLDKPIVVIIDDIDRLEKDEVFEVLRLIRNTADLSNVIYLVAYDKNYVTSVLNDKKNIQYASNYLEKIFQIEIQLPLVSDDSIWTTLIVELEKQLIKEKIDFKFCLDDQQLILKILNTYRRAKRFARLFSLNYSYLKGRESSVELEWRDVFWLDLLQMYNKRIYDTLCYEPKILLEQKDEDTLWVYCKTENAKIYIQEIEVIIDLNTHEILKRLWGEMEDFEPSAYSIRHVAFLEKYLTLQIQFSKSDIDRLVSEEDVDKLVKNWKEKGKDFNFILNRLNDYDTSSLYGSQKKKFLLGVLTVWYYDYEKYYKYERENKIKSIIASFSNEISQENLFKWIKTWINEKLVNNGNREVLSEIVDSFDNSLLSQNNKKDLIITILQDFFNKEPYYSALDFLDPNSKMYKMIRPFFWGNNKQYVINYTIDILSKQRNKPIMEKFQNAYNKMKEKNIYSPISQDDLNQIKKKCIAL